MVLIASKSTILLIMVFEMINSISIKLSNQSEEFCFKKEIKKGESIIFDINLASDSYYEFEFTLTVDNIEMYHHKGVKAQYTYESPNDYLTIGCLKTGSDKEIIVTFSCVSSNEKGHLLDIAHESIVHIYLGSFDIVIKDLKELFNTIEILESNVRSISQKHFYHFLSKYDLMLGIDKLQSTIRGISQFKIGMLLIIMLCHIFIIYKYIKPKYIRKFMNMSTNVFDNPDSL